MGDEDLYLEATNEVEGDKKDPALWAKVMALSEGDHVIAKYQYIKLRVEQLKVRKKKYVEIRSTDKIKTKTKTISAKKYAEDNNITPENVIELIEENKLKGLRIGDTWYVKIEELNSINTKNTEAIFMNSQNMEKKEGFFASLSNGDYGLAKTYWLYGVLVGVIVNFIANIITSVGGYVILVLGYTAYEIPVLLGIWRASEKYTGPNIWAILAKIAVVLGWLFLGIGLMLVFKLINA